MFDNSLKRYNNELRDKKGWKNVRTCPDYSHFCHDWQHQVGTFLKSELNTIHILYSFTINNSQFSPQLSTFHLRQLYT
jgi:hypothetical protein